MKDLAYEKIMEMTKIMESFKEITADTNVPRFPLPQFPPGPQFPPLQPTQSQVAAQVIPAQRPTQAQVTARYVPKKPP